MFTSEATRVTEIIISTVYGELADWVAKANLRSVIDIITFHTTRQLNVLHIKQKNKAKQIGRPE